MLRDDWMQKCVSVNTNIHICIHNIQYYKSYTGVLYPSLPESRISDVTILIVH